MHSVVRLLQYSDIEAVYDDPDRAARLAGLLRDRDDTDSLVVGSGDNTAPGVLAMIARGRQALPFFDAAGTQFETFGNHDFDFGPDTAREVVADSQPTWLSANVRDEHDDPFGHEAGVRPWTVASVDGQQIGLVGLTDPATDTLNPSARELSFTDPVPAAHEAIRALRSAGVDHLVALSHLGRGDDTLARETELDLVLGGHVHSRRLDRVDGTLIARPGVNGRAIVEAELTQASVDADLIELTDTDPPAASGLADRLRAYGDSAGLDRVVGHVETPLARTNKTVYGGESRIGNFVTDAYRHGADADVGLQNSGGIRLGDPLAESVSVADCISIVPFEELLVSVGLTGAELRAVAHQMAGTTTNFGEDGWWHGHVSGARIVYDTQTETLKQLTIGGQPVVDDGEYRVAVPEYLLYTDSEFPAIKPHHRVAEHDIQHELLVEHAQNGGLSVEIGNRIILQS
jgi:5''-nucleotidase/2'',3''-cyclic phosphodiesterase and related esterases